jgi:4'-phosphopantetheinyl transferase
MLDTSVWRADPGVVRLAKDQVHVWCALLGRANAGHLFDMLAPDERARAARYRLERDRRRFVVGRGLLRLLLGRYLQTAPERVDIRYEAAGRPYVAAPDPIQFSLSHSAELALYAFARHRPIGIDVEQALDRPDALRVAERFFSRRESAALRALPADRQVEGFLNCWTRKEAYLKARGEGLTAPLDRFDVSLEPGVPARLLRVEGDPEERRRWSLRALESITGYVSAICVRGHDWRLSCWKLADDNRSE